MHDMVVGLTDERLEQLAIVASIRGRTLGAEMIEALDEHLERHRADALYNATRNLGTGP
jgi:hypothetical protein